jgi:hypothetical protein
MEKKMKIANLIKKINFKLAAWLSISFMPLSVFADSDDTSMTLGGLVGSINSISGNVATVVVLIATVGGVVLIGKGLVHLKQHHGGSSQEKHLSKGVSSLIFGAALILIIPITHMLTQSVDASGTNFNTGVSEIVLNS